MAMLSGFFGVLAALLATIGLYGVMAYVMQRRRNEVGIRLALGAQPGQVVRMVMRDAAVLVRAASRRASRWPSLAGRGSRDAAVRSVADRRRHLRRGDRAGVGMALLASRVPALRASRVDPMLALRQD